MIPLRLQCEPLSPFPNTCDLTVCPSPNHGKAFHNTSNFNGAYLTFLSTKKKTRSADVEKSINMLGPSTSEYLPFFRPSPSLELKILCLVDCMTPTAEVRVIVHSKIPLRERDRFKWESARVMITRGKSGSSPWSHTLFSTDGLPSRVYSIT